MIFENFFSFFDLDIIYLSLFILMEFSDKVFKLYEFYPTIKSTIDYFYDEINLF